MSIQKDGDFFLSDDCCKTAGTGWQRVQRKTHLSDFESPKQISATKWLMRDPITDRFVKQSDNPMQIVLKQTTNVCFTHCLIKGRHLKNNVGLSSCFGLNLFPFFAHFEENEEPICLL